VAPYYNEVDMRLASVFFTTHVIYSSDLSPIIVCPFLIRFQYNIVRYMAIISHDNKVQNDYYVSRFEDTHSRICSTFSRFSLYHFRATR
jgi:hypothetical protein